MESTSTITIEHIVITSNQPYEKVLEALKARMGSIDDWKAIVQKITSVASANPSWEKIVKIIETHLGESGFTIFNTVEHTPLIALSGKASRVTQYLAGNPLLAVQMSRLLPEVALYAPLRFAVYVDEAGQTFVAYDNFASQLGQYQREEINRVAQEVQDKLRTLLMEVTQ
jgi:uncharacterized protein (DUF302 family)